MRSRYRSVGMAVFVIGSHLFAHAVQARIISSNSFESPVVSNRVAVAPDGWIASTGYGTGTAGLENENSGTFSTPYGSQAAVVWRGPDRSCLTTSESMFTDTLVAGITYTVTCYVAAPTNQPGDYDIELVAFPAGDSRDYYNLGTVIAQSQGTATQSNMTEQVSFSFTPDTSHPNLGQLLAIRINRETRGVVDNLVFEDDAAGGDVFPPALWYRYPRDDQRTATVDYPLLMTFNEEVLKGTGNITLYQASDHNVYETIDVTSEQVVVVSNEVTVTRALDLQRDEAYYVTIDTGAFVDLATNDYPGIVTTNQWNFSTPEPDGIEVIYETSFESPVVSGRSGTDPDGWIAGVGYGTGSEGLCNTNYGTFTTPYGSQMAMIWGNTDRCVLTTSTNAFDTVLQAGYPYTVSFNMCNPDDPDFTTGAYYIQLVAYTNGAPRNLSRASNEGTVLAEAQGTVFLPDMAAAADAFTFVASEGDPSIGKLLGVRLWGALRNGCGAIDNLKFTWQPPPPAGTVLIVK